MDQKIAQSSNSCLPLFVDVDGTLTRADISIESFVTYSRTGIFAALRLIFWLIRGRAFAKMMVARHCPIDPNRLPYRPEVLALIQEAQAEGRHVILASASHWRNILRVSRHVGLSDKIIATDGRHNMKGACKLAAIRHEIGETGTFSYVGDSKADIPLWREGVQRWSTGFVPKDAGVIALDNSRHGRFRSYVRALRPHQWAKNGLVLVPLATSGLTFAAGCALRSIFAAIFVSMIASSVYLINDVLDIESDRLHRTKFKRPIAYGSISIPAALLISITLLVCGLYGSFITSGTSLLVSMAAYYVITVAYSFRLKSAMVADVIVLASLYTVRIWIGATAISVSLSFWLLLFSVFLFLSLAYLKRYIELREATDPSRLLSGRGYVASDLDVVLISGVSSGMVSILVMALFANDIGTARHYASPQLLWFICLPLLYWINRIWMMARRGQVDGDPVAFAIRDPRSIAVGVCVVLIFLAAQSVSLPFG